MTTLLRFPNALHRIFPKKFPKNSLFIAGNKYWNSQICTGSGGKSYSQNIVKNEVHSPLGEVKVPDILFHELIFAHWNFWEWRTAIACGRTGRKYTFRKLRVYSMALAAWFQNGLKVSKGDIIALVLPNCPEYPVIFLAASQIGAVLTTVNPFYTAFEIKHQIVATGAKVIITYTNLYDKCIEISEEMKTTFSILVIREKKEDLIPPGATDLLELFDHRVAGDFKPVDIKPTDTLVVPFSSGTSGIPKGVILTHRNLVANLCQLSHPDTMIIFPPSWIRQTSVLGVLPMCHIFGMVVMTFLTLKEGCRLIVLPSFQPREFVKTLYWKKINVLYTVPPLISFLTNEAIRPRYLKNLRFLVNGASRYVVKDVEEVFRKAEHVKLAQGYGLTETSPVLTHTSSKRMQKLVTVGIPVASTKLKIADLKTREALPPTKEGELCASGPQVMKGYLSKGTSEDVFENGWIKTGDLAYYDEDGDFFIVDRLKELIKVSGYQVAPAEVEETLKIHPKIKEAIVVGVPNEKHGEVPKAFIIPQRKGDLTEEEVHQFLSEKLSRYKHLKGGVVFVDEYPRSSTGKVLRAELKKRG